MENSLKKGNLVFVEGKLTHRKWQDKEGNDRYTTEVVGGIIKPLERRESGSSGSSSDAGFPSIEDRYQTAEPAAQPTPQATAGDASSVEDDLPF